MPSPGNGVAEAEDEPAVLHPSFGEKTLAHFASLGIAWSHGHEGGPSRSEVSSQVACVNHLEPARLDAGVARAVVSAVLPSAESVVPIDGEGFVAYEWIGADGYLGERGRTRGANCTSLDAVMVAGGGGKRTLLLIEWKNTESYPAGRSIAVSRNGTDRIETYRPLLERKDCPIAVPCGDLGALFYDPLDQLMRQTLLGWQMVEAGEFGASDWLHVHVVPEENRKLRDTNTSPDLPGDTLSEAWRGVLEEPGRYRMLPPSELLAHVPAAGEWSEWREWLAERYGTSSQRADERRG